MRKKKPLRRPGPPARLGIFCQKTPKKGLKILFDQKNVKIFPGSSRQTQTSKNAINIFLGRSSTPQEERKNFWTTPLPLPPRKKYTKNFKT